MSIIIIIIIIIIIMQLFIRLIWNIGMRTELDEWLVRPRPEGCWQPEYKC